MPGTNATGDRPVRAAEVIAALSLATDLAARLPFEHGLHSTLVGMRLADRLGVGAETASQTYYACMLFYVGCTADADTAAELFPSDSALVTHFNPVMFGSRAEILAGLLRALSDPESAGPARALQAARGLPRATRVHRGHMAAVCEVAQMLTVRLGLPASSQGPFAQLAERWDGKGEPGLASGDELSLAVRIAHVARDATFQCLIGGTDHAADVVSKRGGHAFDPAVANVLAQDAAEILALDGDGSAWDEALALEPSPSLELRGTELDRALGAMGDFADLASPYLVGHSAGVAALAAAAAERCGLDAADLAEVRRAALVHDVGRVAVPHGVWQKPAALTSDEWEQVRLHPYHSDRVLSRSPFLAGLAPIATCHHERLDGSGYHRGLTAPGIPTSARIVAAADAYHAMTEPRPHRGALAPEAAADELAREGSAGRLDPDAVTAVLEAAGGTAPRIERPAGLTEREAEVVGLLARGLQTKQVARALGISAKTADRHIQNAYRKIGVSTRAAAALFAMEHGLATWGELPIGRDSEAP